MKVVNLIKYIALIMIFAAAAMAQETVPQPTPTQVSKVQTEMTPMLDKVDSSSETKTTGEKSGNEKSVDTTGSKSAQAVSQTANNEEKEILSYYKSYIDNYTLGPTDVISIEVFGQCPNYCRTNITIPPTGKIQFQLIKGGIFVAGKTVEQVGDEVRSKLEEYIIDPNVTVTLDKAMSVRYSVLGKVANPGVRVMERRMTIYEAIVEAGGVTKEGNTKKVLLYRYDPKGNLTSQLVDLQAIERGKAPMIELQPGDQVFVADKGFQLNMTNVFDVLSKASIVRLLFGSPF